MSVDLLITFSDPEDEKRNEGDGKHCGQAKTDIIVT